MARILTRSGGSFDHKMAEMINDKSKKLFKRMFLNKNLIGKKAAYAVITTKKGEQYAST